MMELLFHTFYIFFNVLEMILAIYVVLSWFPFSKMVQQHLKNLVAPILDPVRALLKHSIFNSQVADLSPIITFLIILYLQKYFYRQ